MDFKNGEPARGSFVDPEVTGPCLPDSASNGHDPRHTLPLMAALEPARILNDESVAQNAEGGLLPLVTEIPQPAFRDWPRTASGTLSAEDMELARFDRTLLEGEVLVVSVLFADLRGFTAVAEQLAPRRMAGLLNTYL